MAPEADVPNRRYESEAAITDYAVLGFLNWGNARMNSRCPVEPAGKAQRGDFDQS